MKLARLRGEARNVILPEIGSEPPAYWKAMKQLRKRFGEPKHPSFHVAQMRGRRRKDKKNLPELAQWFKKIGLKAYPSERTDTRDRILLDTFVRALPDEQQRCYVWDKEPEGTRSCSCRSATLTTRFFVHAWLTISLIRPCCNLSVYCNTV